MHGNTGSTEATAHAGPAYLEQLETSTSVMGQVADRLEDPMWLLRRAYWLLEERLSDPGWLLRRAYSAQVELHGNRDEVASELARVERLLEDGPTYALTDAGEAMLKRRRAAS